MWARGRAVHSAVVVLRRPHRERSLTLPGLCLTLGLGLAACASDEPPPPPEPEPEPTAEEHYQRGLEILEGERLLFFFRSVDYPAAIEAFQQIIDSYPYSEYATLAELKIADVHFRRRDYEEAASFYQDFVELHPSHPEVPYAIYRNGLCSFERMREADRDQEPTRQAIAQFEALLQRHPDAPVADDARRKLEEARTRLAEREIRVADFYFDQGIYHAAVHRYRRALEAYPQHADRALSRARLGISLARTSRPLEAEQLLRQALAVAEDDDLRERILEELDRLAELPVGLSDGRGGGGDFVGE